MASRPINFVFIHFVGDNHKLIFCIFSAKYNVFQHYLFLTTLIFDLAYPSPDDQMVTLILNLFSPASSHCPPDDL